MSELERVCNLCNNPSVLTVERFDIVADRCAAHSTGLRGAAEENRDGSWSILDAADLFDLSFSEDVS